jgi:hypothetical protein
MSVWTLRVSSGRTGSSPIDATRVFSLVSNSARE